jgi:hypothetical protein
MIPAQQIQALQHTFRAAAKEAEAAAAKASAALAELAVLRQSSGIAVPSKDEALAAMAQAGVFCAWRRQGWRTIRLSRKTERGLAPVVETWLRPWLVEHVAADTPQALVAAILRADPEKHFPVVDGVPPVPEVAP